MAPKDPEKRSRLTLEKLASYDDVITDALVDRVYFWTIIRKNRGGRFSASRGLHEEDIADILRQTVILEKDPATAVKRLVQLSALRMYVDALKNPDEKEHFTRHLRKYVNLYMPDCPFEVTTTNRYTISEHEASVTARKEIRKGEEIKYLTGVQVAMTEEQEKTLDLARKDFSIVISSRKKTRSLFLGPARFANHDCDANARLSTKGFNGMQIVAVKNIDVGEEITVSYGEDYFGEDNEECLCNTCESQLVNGWAPFKATNADSEEATPEPEETLQQEGPYSFRKKRKYDATDTDASPDGSPSPAKKPKIEEPLRSPIKSPSKRRSAQPLRKTTLKKAYSASSLRQEVPLSSIEDPTTNLAPSPQISREIRTQQRVGLLTVTLDETSSSRSTTPQSSIAAGSPQSSLSTEATSVDDDSAMTGTEEKVKAESDTIFVKPTLQITTTIKATSLILDDDNVSLLSELSNSLEFDDDNQQIVKRKRSKTPTVPRTTRSQSRNTEKLRVATPVPLDTVEAGHVENTRQSGDYKFSDSLLSAKLSRWVECHTCDNKFVQSGETRTRNECPRCERHSKLYGYPWPKTDKEGKHDIEERVLDHRTVHRFVGPEEEKKLKKDRKFLKDRLSSSRLSTPQSSRELSFSTEVESGRKKRRVRKTM